MYKLIAIDMDGTFLKSNGEASEENIIALKNAMDKGVKIVFTTGRGIRAVHKFIDKIGFGDKGEYVITNNGVSLYSVKDLKCLKADFIFGDTLLELCNLGLNMKPRPYIHVYEYKTEGCIVLEDNDFAQFEKNHIGMPLIIDPDFIKNIGDDTKAFKVLFAGDREVIDKVQERIPQNILDRFTVVRTLPQALELFDKKCNKGNAVKNLANMLNIKQEEVIAIGDQQNDYEMIKLAGLGIAMGNAIDELKEIANYITDTNDNNGVEKVINKFILNKNS